MGYAKTRAEGQETGARVRHDSSTPAAKWGEVSGAAGRTSWPLLMGDKESRTVFWAWSRRLRCHLLRWGRLEKAAEGIIPLGWGDLGWSLVVLLPLMYVWNGLVDVQAKTENEQQEFRGAERAGDPHLGWNRTKAHWEQSRGGHSELGWSSDYKWRPSPCHVSTKEEADFL